jgi:Flp pilus assembly protein TadG
MRQTAPSILRKLIRETCGVEIAETAAILPLLFMVLMAIYGFGQAYRIYGTLTHAARVGARAAVAPACSTCAATTSAQNAQTAIQTELKNAHLDKKQLVSTASWTPPALCDCSSVSPLCKTPVSCDSSVTNVCVQANVRLSYTSQGGMGTCGTSVSMRYQFPYHFGIPGTSLDLGNLQLPGQAEMRLETQ